LKARRGGLVANKALARKLASMFWQVMVHGVEYVEHGLNKYDARVAITEQRLLRKLAHKLNYEILPKTPELATVPGRVGVRVCEVPLCPAQPLTPTLVSSELRHLSFDWSLI
jgi:hypothetical protein